MRRLSVASLVVGLACAFSVAALPAQSASADTCAYECAGNPSVSVAAASTSVTLGSSAQTLMATATLTGGSNATGTITFTLLDGSSTVDMETDTVSGNGTYPTPTGYTLPTTGTVPGTYQWNAEYSGDTNNSGAGDENDPAGQVAVSTASPSLTSLPSPASLGLDSTATTLQDTASLSGGYYPTGTITFTLYQGSNLLDTETDPVSGDGSYSTPTGYSLPATPGSAGTYQWDETYSGDSNNNSATDVNDGAEDVSPVCTGSSAGATCAFGYTGEPVAWTVPAGVTTLTMVADGAQGGAGANGAGGLGGQATADVPVTPGEVLQIDVGQAGSSQAAGGAGGWNGGGSSGGSYAAGGGGASDIRDGTCVSTLTCDMTDAVVVGGGGGGGGSNGGGVGGYIGGAGGGVSGGSPQSPYGGGGGTQTAGGVGGDGAPFCQNGAAGTLGQGGTAGPTDLAALCQGGGGGGGGYYGGGGGAAGQAAAYTGGGGSGFGPANRTSFASGVQSGNGAVYLSWPATGTAPAITSADSAQFPTGQADSFTVTTNPLAWPVPALSETGTLPAGVTFTDNGDGSATLAGTPSPSDAGTYQFQVSASNGVSPDATQDFTLTVGTAPQITSPDQTEIDLGSSGSFTVTTTGDPVSALTETGALPNGVTFTDNGNGTATIAGTPNQDNGPVEGYYPITITASQTGGSWTPATQAFTLTVGGNPGYTSLDINATGTDGTALNPGMGLAINGSACYNYLSGTDYVILCPAGDYLYDNLIGSGRRCGSDDLPLATNAAVATCWQRYVVWDPADVMTLSTPATTDVTIGTQTQVYTFDHWDTSGQSVGCNGGNTSTSCTFEVPSSGVDITAVYDPPIACAAGSYSTTGMEPCTQAPAGSYDSGTGNMTATPCLAGSFSATAGSASCTPAPVGDYASGTGNTAATPCAAGSYTSTTGNASCTQAPAGDYDSGTGNTAATPCAAGSFSANAGSTSCTQDPAGDYSGAGSSAATPCAAGSYSANAGSASCTPAPAGSYASGTGNTASTLCPAGTYSANPGSASCAQTPAGSFDSGTGNTAATPCPAGTYSGNQGSSSCTQAPAGSYASGTGNTAATPCPAGTYSANAGSASCTQAPAGSYASGTGNTAATPCPAGSFSAAAGSASCTQAPAGSYASGTGNTASVLCPAGTYSVNAGSASCTQAPAGSYASGTGNTASTLCPAGSYSANAGSASCTQAPAGSYASGTGDTASTLCPAGSYSAAAGSASCTQAPAGSYDAGTGNTAATPCPSGTTSPAGATACTATSTSLAYNGPTQVAVSATLVPTAVLSASAAACVAGQPVSFSLSADPLNGTAGTYSLGSGNASATGAVTGPSVSTTGWENGVYTITASYAGATVGAVNCPAATTSASLAVTVAGQAALGDGSYTVPGVGTASFAFVVALKAHTTSTYTGALALVVPGKWLFQASVTSYGKTSSTQGLLGGTGTLYWWNTTLNHGQGGWQLAKSGVTYTATANAATKSAAASFGITINYTPVSPQPTSLPNSAPLPLSKGVIVLT